MNTICVYCGSQMGSASDYQLAAQQLGKSLVAHNIDLVYGGASVGLMSEIANTVLAEGGKVTGVIPKGILEKEIAHKHLSELHIVDSMHTRKRMMADLSDGFIAMPGGFGTLEELFEILTWRQLGLLQKPCGLYNVSGYFDPLIKLIEHTVKNGFVSATHRDMLEVNEYADALISQLKNSQPVATKHWDINEQLER